VFRDSADDREIKLRFSAISGQNRTVQKFCEVIFEDADLLVVNKPAGLVCHPTKGDEWSSLISRARLHLGPGSAPSLINRLDRETSGVVIIAKNPATAGQLGKLWEKHAVTKEYLAIVHDIPSEGQSVIDLALGKDETSQIAIKDCVRPDGASARTEFRVEKPFHHDSQDFALLRLWPKTGRKHQIRIHLAALGHPIVGDKLYGGDEDLYLAFVRSRLTEDERRRLILPNHALHACSIRFVWRAEEKLFQAPPNEDFTNFLNGLGRPVPSSPCPSLPA